MAELFLFVSHVSEDRSAAMQIVDELERRGVRCWVAPRDVHPGKPFDDEIADAIEGSAAMLLIFSEHCNQSEYIRREVTVAGESHKVIIPFRIENALPRRGLRVRLSDLHWIDGFSAWQEGIDELVRIFHPASDEAVHQIRDESAHSAKKEPAHPAQKEPLDSAADEVLQPVKNEPLERARDEPALAITPDKVLPTVMPEAVIGPRAERTGPAWLWLVFVTVCVLGAVGIGLLVAPRPAVVTSSPPAVTPKSTATPEVAANRADKPLSPGEERAKKPGEAFKECDKCPEMVVVPRGNFTMGSPKEELKRRDNESPQHMVALRRFAVGVFAVTFDEWDACAADGGCNGYRPDDRNWGRGPQPVINVSWQDAKAYMAWLAEKTGQPYRLLSESEREYVTRAGTTTAFWWGNSISTSDANYNGNETYGNGVKEENRARPLPVESFKPNPWGLYQVHGNVFDWTEDCYHDSYQGAPSDGSAWITGDCRQHLVRGGSWQFAPAVTRSASRAENEPTLRHNALGFRVARSLAP